MSTNGSLLDDDILSRIGFQRIRLTFDGNEIYHNQLKQVRLFSYRQQMLLVEKILREYSSNLEIRCNVCKENAGSVNELLNDLTSLADFSWERVRVCFARLRDEKNSDAFTELSQSEFALARVEFLSTCHRLGMPLTVPSPASLPCEFGVGRAFCLGPGVKSRYCAEKVKQSSDGAKPRKYVAREHCKGCTVFPLCLGSCSMASGEQACIPERYALVEELKAYVAANDASGGAAENCG